jgi:hypothetical protein
LTDNGKITIKLSELTLGELEAVEDIVGRSIMGDISRGSPTMRTIRGLLWIVRRRSEPDLKFEDLADVKILDVDIDDSAPGPKGKGA